MKKPFISVLIATTLLTGSLPMAARDLNQDEALRLRQQGAIMPLEKLLEIVQTRYPGSRLLEAELEEDDGEYIYEIELLTRQGVVRDVEIDAHSGRILKDEEDD